MSEIDEAAIADLLTQARAAHLAYRHALSDGPAPDATLAREAMQRAYDLRVAAEALDPQLTAGAFRSEPENFQHQAVQQFYAEQLAR